jgi:hypothetical protein
MGNPVRADQPKPASGLPVGGGAFVSHDAKTVFVPAKDGVILALDITTGKEIWKSDAAPKLAGVTDKLVVGWSAGGSVKKPNAFRVVVLDAATGKTVKESDPIEMPEWATTVKTWGQNFRLAARAEGDAVVVVWQANAFYAGGARPTPEIEEAARKEAIGVVTIDLKTGKVAAVDRKPKPDEFKGGPDGGLNAKVGGYEFRVTETTPKLKPGAAMVTTVTLTVLKGKDELWKRELAGNPWSPPPP